MHQPVGLTLCQGATCPQAGDQGNRLVLWHSANTLVSSKPAVQKLEYPFNMALKAILFWIIKLMYALQRI